MFSELFLEFRPIIRRYCETLNGSAFLASQRNLKRTWMNSCIHSNTKPEQVLWPFYDAALALVALFIGLLPKWTGKTSKPAPLEPTINAPGFTYSTNGGLWGAGVPSNRFAEFLHRHGHSQNLAAVPEWDAVHACANKARPSG